MKQRLGRLRTARRFGAGRLARIDETAVTTKRLRPFARAPAGARVAGLAPGSCRRFAACGALSTVAAMRGRSFEEGEAFAAATLPGAFRKETFLFRVKEALCPQLRRGEIVAPADCRIRHQAAVRRALRKVGCDLRRLPPYGPDSNPIEKLRSKPKTALRTVAARSVAAVRAALPRAFRTLAAADIAGWINHSHTRVIS